MCSNRERHPWSIRDIFYDQIVLFVCVCSRDVNVFKICINMYSGESSSYQIYGRQYYCLCLSLKIFMIIKTVFYFIRPVLIRKYYYYRVWYVTHKEWLMITCLFIFIYSFEIMILHIHIKITHPCASYSKKNICDFSPFTPVAFNFIHEFLYIRVTWSYMEKPV